MKKKLFKQAFYAILTIFYPFIWAHRKYKRRKALVNFSHIVEGFSNHVFPNEKMEDLAKTRAAICARCPFAKYSPAAKVVVVDSRTKEVSGMYCDICGCNLSAKVRSRDYCPKGKW